MFFALTHHGITVLQHGILYQKKILSELQVADDNRALSSLSGGQKKKLSILLAIQDNPDLVIFDEPTNHLDLMSVLWLESLLSKANFAWICISHDRKFLSQTAKSILEINPVYEEKHLSSDKGYKDFLKFKEEVLADITPL